jgi:uncharacterized protein YbaP (TraB family)
MKNPRNTWWMRVAILVVVLVTAFFVVFSARAQPPGSVALPDADPAMWVVRDADTTIYLFGTFHIMDGRAEWFNDEIREAFDRSRELVLEADIAADPVAMAARMQPAIERYAIDPQGRTISSRLTAEENRTLNEALGAIGVPAGSYDRMEPWFINMMMIKALGQRMGGSIESGAEMVLRRAAGRRMAFHALETVEDQFRVFDQLPEEGQLAQLKLMLDNWDAVGAQLPRMLAVWNRGDAEGLDRILNASIRGNTTLRQALLENRNRAWSDWIVERLRRPGRVFMAVGVGHLTGPDSVQAILSQRGIRSARVQSGGARRTPPPRQSR